MDAKQESSETKRTIALCQATPVPGDPRANTKKVITWMARAAKSGADIALFGELFLSDYDLCNVHSLSEPQDGPAAVAIAKAAKDMGIAVIYGYSEVYNDRYYNSLMFINSHGERLANYRKVHLWPTETRQYTQGNELTVVDWEGLRVGMGICVDVCMYEYVGTMVVNGGAQLIVIANALVDGSLYEKSPRVLVPARALENRCYIAYVDLAGEKYLGMSRVCSPMAECLVAARTTEEVLLTTTIPLNTDKGVPFRYSPLRRPEMYNSTVAYETEVPWKRETRQGVQQLFKHRAQYYDKQMEGVYNGPTVAAQALATITNERNRKVLDVAAGTGLVGKAMSNEGFTNIIALDRSEEMLKYLAQKKVYSEVIRGEFEQEVRKIASESFHACVCVGAFLTAGFLNPFITVEEMIRVVEVGGFVLLLWNATELDEPQCEATRESLREVLDRVVKNELCECVQTVSVPNYLKECMGCLVIMRKTKPM